MVVETIQSSPLACDRVDCLGRQRSRRDSIRCLKKIYCIHTHTPHTHTHPAHQRVTPDVKQTRKSWTILHILFTENLIHVENPCIKAAACFSAPALSYRALRGRPYATRSCWALCGRPHAKQLKSKIFFSSDSAMYCNEHKRTQRIARMR